MSIEERARKLADDDWIGVLGPAPTDNWERLTFGEQHRYYTRAMQNGNKEPQVPKDLTQAERGFLNRKIIDAVGWIMRWRELNGGRPQA